MARNGKKTGGRDFQGRFLKGLTPPSQTHGHTKGQKRTKIYTCWRNMISRCYQPSSSRYNNYGARGISVCEKWHSFEKFVEDMGQPPTKNHSIERVDVNGNYDPSNCQWIDKTKQSLNTTRSRLLTYNGNTKCLGEWAKEYHISYHVLWKRLRRGWEIEKALTFKKAS